MQKSDGDYTYFVPDVAYHFDKWERGFDRVINEQGADHHSTINRVRAGLQGLNKGIPITWPEYILHQMITVLKKGVEVCGLPCVVKPLISSSGKGQSIIKSQSDIQTAWNYAMEGSRGDLKEVIVEEFVDFDFEITLLTLTQDNGNTLFCPPIGHRQERSDYQESWQPMSMNDIHLKKAQEMAEKVTTALQGSGIWGVEFFIGKSGVYFSELSPRPHDTGMVTLANTQNLSEFELHARAILGIPVQEIKLLKNGASAVILADKDNSSLPVFSGLEKASSLPDSDFKIFGKPTSRPYRRMAVALSYGISESTDSLVERAKHIADIISVD